MRAAVLDEPGTALRVETIVKPEPKPEPKPAKAIPPGIPHAPGQVKKHAGEQAPPPGLPHAPGQLKKLISHPAPKAHGKPRG